MARRRNGMCPVCYLKALVNRKRGNIPTLYAQKPYDNGMALTPPMGWSSWNTFQERIDQNVIYGMAEAMRQKGLVDAGYVYLNIDDCWEAKERNEHGELEPDYVTFPDGMRALSDKVRGVGMKLGLYSSNGSYTCQEYPGTQGHEYIDAYTFAKWGIEYWKLDFCHNTPYTKYAPWVAGISVNKQGEPVKKVFTAEEGVREGSAHVFKTSFRGKASQYDTQTLKTHVSGLDAGEGSIEYAVSVPEDGEYVLTVYTHERYSFEKYLIALVNGEDVYGMHIPKNVRWNEYTTQKKIMLKKGVNKIRLLNPIDNNATSDMLQYQYMGDCIKRATARYAEESGTEERKMVFSICEWGSGKPYLWGASAGNLWRTTFDIQPNWNSVCKLYEQNVELYKYASPGHWNDPDMLEVGVGNLTYNENVAHFALWCMMASPLILGNDIRSITDEVLSIITNKALISIDQDPLGKQCKRIVNNAVQVLVKPLSGGKTAICLFNKGERTSYDLSEDIYKNEEYISYDGSLPVTDCLTGKAADKAEYLRGEMDRHSVKVFIVG